jgi:hypothetical protein
MEASSRGKSEGTLNKRNSSLGNTLQFWISPCLKTGKLTLYSPERHSQSKVSFIPL